MTRCRLASVTRCRVASVTRCRVASVTRCRVASVTRCRLASGRHGNRCPPQCSDGSFPPSSARACRPVRSDHASLRRAHCERRCRDRLYRERRDGTRRRLRPENGRDTRGSRGCGCSGAHRSRRSGCSDARCPQGTGCSGIRRLRRSDCSGIRRLRRSGWSGARRCQRTGWFPAVRLLRPGVSSRESRHSRAPTDHGGPGPWWSPSAHHRRPAYGYCARPVSWPAGGDRPPRRSDLPGGHLRQPRCADGPGQRRPMPVVPGRSCQRPWRLPMPSGCRYRLPGSSASRIPRPRSSTSSFNTTQTSEEGRSTTSGATLFKHVRRRPTLPRGPPRSTIGAEGLNFRVRNGTGCFPFAITAETLLRCH